MSSVELGAVILEDSFLLNFDWVPTSVALTLEAALAPGHPEWTGPPKPGEQHTYSTVRVQIAGGLRWLDGPLLPLRDPLEGDLGTLDWWNEGGSVHLAGSFGHVVIDDPTTSIEWG